MKANPEKAVEAIINPAPLTLSQLAMFEKIDAPIMRADATSLHDNLIAVWIYKTPIREVVRNFDKREECALAMSEKMTGDEYGIALAELMKAITAFYEMIPRQECSDEDGEGDAEGEDADGQGKKRPTDSATVSLPSSGNGCVEPTTTRPSMSLRSRLRCAWHCFIALGRRLTAD